MSGPVASWNTVPVFGKWLQLDGTAHTGSIKFTLPQRITNAPQDVIFPAGGVLTFALVAGAIRFDCPILDDPDNFPIDASVVIKVEEKLLTGNGATYNIRPTGDMAPVGLDLRGIQLPGIAGGGSPALLRGVAGGLAALDSDGNVLDGDGNVVSVAGALASITSISGGTP